MNIALLDLISTPVPILNSLGLDVAVGLSSEDPIGERRPSESYQAYLTIYDPHGKLVDRVCLGELPPFRRRRYELSEVTRRYVPHADHLAVVHRVPVRLLEGGRRVEDVVELTPEEANFVMYRGMVEFSYPGGSNGGVIYETPHGLNVPRPGHRVPSTLTFTSQVVVSESVNTCIALMYYSLDPGYDRPADYTLTFFAPTGERVVTETRRLSPFTVEVIDAKRTIPQEVIEIHRDPSDGLTCFTYVGWSTDGILIPLVINLAPELKAVAVEHTHPPQTYTCPSRPEDKHKWKSYAIGVWSSMATHPSSGSQACQLPLSSKR